MVMMCWTSQLAPAMPLRQSPNRSFCFYFHRLKAMFPFRFSVKTQVQRLNPAALFSLSSAVEEVQRILNATRAKWEGMERSVWDTRMGHTGEKRQRVRG